MFDQNVHQMFDQNIDQSFHHLILMRRRCHFDFDLVRMRDFAFGLVRMRAWREWEILTLVWWEWELGENERFWLWFCEKERLVRMRYFGENERYWLRFGENERFWWEWELLTMIFCVIKQLLNRSYWICVKERICVWSYNDNERIWVIEWNV